jgi:hypothetical protein
MSHDGDKQDQQQVSNRIKAVMQDYKQDLLAKANVVGIGIGYRQLDGKPTDKLALVVMVAQKIPATELSQEDQIPATLEGIPIDVQEVGELTAQ